MADPRLCGLNPNKERGTMQTKTFTPEEVSAYLGDPIVTPDHDLSIITTAISVIGRYPLDSEDRDPDMVDTAMSHIQDWAGDYGVKFDFVVEENEV